MKYITKKDFKKSMSERDFLDLLDNGDEVMQDDILQYANEKSVAEVETYLRGKYDLPLIEPIDLQITSLVGDMMKYHLYKRRDENHLSENIIKMYERAISRLKDIEAGKSILFTNKTQSLNDSTAYNQKSVIGINKSRNYFGGNFTKLF